MVLPVKERRDRIYYKAYSIVNNTRGWGLKNQDILIFGELLNKIVELKKTVSAYHTRMLILFNKETKKEIINKLGINYNSFMNSITKLRKIGLIEEGNLIDEDYAFDIKNNHYIIEIQYTIEDGLL